MPHDDWIDDSEYPDDRDVADFGDDSPVDYDPLTIGYVKGVNPPFWTTGRIIAAVFVLLMIGVLLLPVLSRLF